jgi:hypothetical protein
MVKLNKETNQQQQQNPNPPASKDVEWFRRKSQRQ